MSRGGGRGEDRSGGDKGGGGVMMVERRDNEDDGVEVVDDDDDDVVDLWPKRAKDAKRRSMNGDDSHNSGTGVRRQAPPAPVPVKTISCYATCNLLGSSLTWWNSHVKTVGHDVAHAMTWTKLMQ
ncbi:hypothetical protein Tco_0695246 [Tanacetum coccineum]